jgi:hypothetical protein
VPTITKKMLEPPIGGLNRRHAYQWQKPYTTAHVLNCLPFDQANGRGRIGTRPGLTAFASSPTGAPYNWCYVNYHNSGLKVGVAITTANGCFVWTGAAWVEWITTATGTDFSTPTQIGQTLIMARGGATTLYQDLASGSGGAGTALGDHPNILGGLDPSGGTPPTDCGLALSHGSRLVLAGDTTDQQIVYLSRSGNIFYDFDYAETDPAAAVALAFKEPVTALLSHTRDCMLVGMTDSLDVVRGTETGAMLIETLSHEVGPLMQSAWCHDATGRLWMFTRDGLYTMQAGCGDAVESVSRESLPAELIAVDPGAGDKVSVCYDHRWRLIHILVNFNSGDDVWFAYDLDGKGFWPLSSSNTWNLAVPIKRSMTTAKSGTILLTTSSSAYQMDRGSGESVTSYVSYGPKKLSDQGYVGKLVDFAARLSSGSGDVDYEIYSGNSPEEAYAKMLAGTPIAFSGRLTIEGHSYLDHPMVTDECFYAKLKSVAAADWSHEGCECGIMPTRGIVRAAT